MNKTLLFLPLLVLPTAAPVTAAEPTATTLRSMGAVGDGRTDDRAANEAALIKSNGFQVDGEGATYAVHGNIEVNGSVNFRNATLVQTMTAVDMAKYIPSAKGAGTLAVQPSEALRTMVDGVPLLSASGVGIYSEDPVLGDGDLTVVLPSVALRTLGIRGNAGKPISVRLEKKKSCAATIPRPAGAAKGQASVSNTPAR